MIYAWYWTIVVGLGLIGAIRNYRDRTANLNALRVRNINHGAQRVANLMRNSELFRSSKASIMFIIGILSLAVGYGAKGWLAKNFGTITAIGLCAMATILTANIWYFGYQGRRILGNPKRNAKSKD